MILPFLKSMPLPAPPARPMSASRASPGPLTPQPRIATVIGALMFAIYSSSSCAIGIKSISIRPQVGQDTSVAALSIKPNDLMTSRPTLISSRGSADKEIRMVSPIPSDKSAPIPAADLTEPENKGPASVIPK